MPWTAEQMTAKGAKDGAKAARIANAVLKRCRAKGGKDCEGMAIRIALGRTNHPQKGK